MSEAQLQPIPARLAAPPASDVKPPVITAPPLLPFGDLSWEDFERLCLALARQEGDPEHCQLYGVRGQFQSGIDLYSRQRAGAYRVYQCKRYESLSPAMIAESVTRFLDGSWASMSEAFVFCTSHASIRTQLADEIEAQAQRLRERNIALRIWDAESLSQELKSHHSIVWDFFGRAWTERFCDAGAEAVTAERLDGPSVQVLRRRLRHFYGRLFARYDTLAITTQRGPTAFVPPDVRRRRELQTPRMTQESSAAPVARFEGPMPPPQLVPFGGDTLLEERLSATGWLAQERRGLLLGGAGTGKSSLLRWLCVELLEDEPELLDLDARWSAFLPVWVPFGRWVASLSTGADVSLGGLLRRFFASFDEPALGTLVDEALADDRIFLLVDGLDEWTDHDAAALAAERLQQLAAMRDIAVLGCGRREALQAMGALDPEWSTAELAPLTPVAQERLLLGLGGGTPHAARQFRLALARTPELSSFAGVPLLLGLLWLLRRPDSVLPANRFRAYAACVVGLREQAISRRRASGELSQLRIAEDQLYSALGELALFAQDRTGALVARGEALICLRDALLHSGVETARAEEQATALLAECIGGMGLVRDNGDGSIAFAHRSLQEHLAARGLHARLADDAVQAVRDRANRPAWAEVILNLLDLVDTAAADGLALAAVSARGGRAAYWLRAPLVASIASGPFSVSAKVRTQLLSEAISVLESGAPAGTRQAVLDALLEATEQVALASVAEGMARRWVPGYSSFGRAAAIDAISSWPREVSLQTTVSHVVYDAISDETTRVSRAAARAVAAGARDDGAVPQRLLRLLDWPLSPVGRAAALECLALGWPHSREAMQLFPRARTSVDPNMQLVAIGWLIHRGEHGVADLDELLAIGADLNDLDYERKSDVARLLLSGWPMHTRVKNAALESVSTMGDRPLELDTAAAVLLQGFSRDADAVAWVVRELATDHPFTAGHDAFALLASHMRNVPEVVAAVDRWLPEQRYRLPEVCYAARVGRTATAKNVLLHQLSLGDGGTRSWPFAALLEEWGMEDEEVAAALRATARGASEAAGEVAHLLRPVLTEREERVQRLLSLLNDPANRRPELALAALGSEDQAARSAALDAAWPLRGSRRGALGYALRDELIRAFPEEPEVVELALDSLNDEEANLGLIARAALQQPALRAPVLDTLTPLPAALRARVGQRVLDGAGSTATVELLARWRAEEDGQAAVAAAAAYAARLRPDERRKLREQALDGLRAPRIHRGVSQASLGALLELGEVSTFAAARWRVGEDRPQTVALAEPFDVNWWLAWRVAANWEDVQAALGDEVAERLTEMSNDERRTWDALAPFAAAKLPARTAVLNYIRSSGALSLNLLRFLAIVRPRSEQLLDAILEAVASERTSGRSEIWSTVDMLASEFGGNTDALRRTNESAADWPEDVRLVALALGWPRSEELKTEWASSQAKERGFSWEAGLRLSLCISGAQEATDVLRRFLTAHERHARFMPTAPPVLSMRTARDRDFVTAIKDVLHRQPSASELASFARLLAAGGRLLGESRTLVEQRRDRALDDVDVDVIALDMIAGTRRSLGLSLHEALVGSEV